MSAKSVLHPLTVFTDLMSAIAPPSTERNLNTFSISVDGSEPIRKNTNIITTVKINAARIKVNTTRFMNRPDTFLSCLSFRSLIRYILFRCRILMRRSCSVILMYCLFSVRLILARFLPSCYRSECCSPSSLL